MSKQQRRTEPAPVEPANDQADAILTVAEVAARWRVSRHTVAAAIKSGRLQAFKPDQRVYRIRESEVRRYEEQHNSSPREATRGVA